MLTECSRELFVLTNTTAIDGEKVGYSSVSVRTVTTGS